jgi:hypothetical protein
MRKPTETELKIINTHFAKKELKEENIYVFDLMAADSETITSVSSRFGKDMIEGFDQSVMARQSDPNASAVAYLFGHDKTKIPSGTLFNSATKPKGENGLSFHPSVYMLKNLDVAGINTDEYIKAYEAGHTEEVSVGFRAGAFMCDLCGHDVRTMECPHIPGRPYNMAKEGEIPQMRSATYTVHQGPIKTANLIETSGVYRGAFPGAKIQDLQLPEGSAFKDGKWFDKEGGTLVAEGSESIKNFKPTDILQFNCAFTGSIEKVGEFETRETILRTELKRATHNLARSEVDKVDLQDALDKANKENDKLKKDLKVKSDIADSFVKTLKERVTKLSIQVNGMHHNEEVFNKEIGNLSTDELKTKIEGLEKQLAETIHVGRLTNDPLKLRLKGGASSKVTSEQIENENTEIFKFKK